jgi:hypothetical protein
MAASNPVAAYLATIGKKGGEAGKGAAKRRTRKQYQEMARKSAEVRRAKRPPP